MQNCTEGVVITRRTKEKGQCIPVRGTDLEEVDVKLVIDDRVGEEEKSWDWKKREMVMGNGKSLRELRATSVVITRYGCACE